MDVVEILLCEGGRRAVARILKHILLFAFLYLALHYIAHIHMLDIVGCVHTCVEPREFHIAPQL